MPNTTRSKRRTPPKWAVIGLMASTPLAVLLYGGVHPVPRWILAGITVAVGLALTLRSRFERRLSLVWALAIGLAFTALSLVPFLPTSACFTATWPHRSSRPWHHRTGLATPAWIQRCAAGCG